MPCDINLNRLFMLKKRRNFVTMKRGRLLALLLTLSMLVSLSVPATAVGEYEGASTSTYPVRRTFTERPLLWTV